MTMCLSCLKHFKLTLYFTLLFFASLALEIDLSQSLSVGGTLVGVLSFIISIVLAFSVYEALTNIFNFAEEKNVGNNKAKYYSIVIVTVLVVGVSFFVNVESDIVSAFINSISLVMIVFILDVVYKLHKYSKEIG